MKFLFDFLPVLLFFIIYQVYKDFYLATGVAIAASAVQVGWMWLRHRRVERMHLIGFVLLLVFGGMGILFRDELFLKWKVSIVNWLFGVVFLGSHFIGRKTLIERMMSSAVELPSNIWTRLNMAWSLFFIAVGVVNIYVAYSFDTDTWVDFKFYGMLGLTLAFVIGQAFYLARYIKTEPEAEEK